LNDFAASGVCGIRPLTVDLIGPSSGGGRGFHVLDVVPFAEEEEEEESPFVGMLEVEGA
jgi:hypothetical protein